ncbi:MAG: sugar phosphate isomerase/epimerase [Armatimonadetes bacterium]|nr:sugar phosphate isomerase/epimerase [Armatimonadota bacterium]
MTCRTFWAVSILTALSAAMAADPPAPPTSPFGSFNFTFDQRPAAEQVALLSRLGYQGMACSGLSADLLRSFAEVPQVASGEFRVWAALWWVGPEQRQVDAAWLDDVLAGLHRLGASLWVVVDGTAAERPAAVTFLRAVADRAKPAGVPLVLYPHQGCTFDDAESALEVWQAMERPEVRLSIHLCHELKAGNENRLDEVVAKVAPLLTLASVSGASAELMHTGGWETAIMPLDRGTFDVRPFLKALAAHGYRGPMVLHTYGIMDPPEDHLARSMARWKALNSVQ